MLPFSSLPIKTSHIKLELYFPSSLQSERDTVKLFFVLFMVTIYLIMGCNNWTPWGDKNTVCSLLVENSVLLDQTHNSAWKALTRLHGKDISLTTPRSLLAHQSIAFTFCPVFTILFLGMARKCCLEKGPVTQQGSLSPAAIHILPSISEDQPGLIGTFGTSAGRAFHTKPSP